MAFSVVLTTFKMAQCAAMMLVPAEIYLETNLRCCIDPKLVTQDHRPSCKSETVTGNGTSISSQTLASSSCPQTTRTHPRTRNRMLQKAARSHVFAVWCNERLVRKMSRRLGEMMTKTPLRDSTTVARKARKRGIAIALR